MLKLAYEYMGADSNRAFEYLDNAKRLSEKANYKKGMASYYYVDGLLIKNDSPKALESFKKSLQLFSELNNKVWMAIIISKIGSIYSFCSQYDKAMEEYLSALKIYESINDHRYIGICYSNIASIYSCQKNHKKALEYHKKALNILKGYGSFNDYLNIAIDYSEMGEYNTSLLYYDSIVHVLNQVNDIENLSIVYLDLGNTYTSLKNYNKSKQYCRASYSLALKTGKNTNLISACINMAESYIKLNQPDSAIILLEKNVGILNQTKSYNLFKEYYKNLSAAYEKKDETGIALKYYKMFKSAGDSLTEELSKQRLYELQTSFEVNRKDEEIGLLNKENLLKSAQLSKQRTIIALVLLSTFLAIILAIISYNRFRLKRKLANILENKNKEIEQQQQEILAMNDMLEKQNEDLQEMDNIKSRFFTNISHEFRTPLSLIIGPLATMQDKAKDPETKREYGLMLKHAHSLLNLINQLLDLSRLQRASLKLQLSCSDINTFLCTLIDSFSSRAAELAITLNYHSTPWPLLVWFDKDKLGKIMVNLLSNALKHTPKKGFIEVSLAGIEEQPGYIEITVRDNGIGIEAYELKNIFEPFYQSEVTINRKIEGSGIGLALAKELVELHGGTIIVSSEAGKGAEFKIRIAVNKDHLPLAGILQDNAEAPVVSIDFHSEVELENTPASKAETKINKDKTTILVVEDNDDMRGYITKNLLQDYQILEATNGKEGYDKALESSPDLIIADVMMPVMDGYEMTRLIKNDPLTCHIPVIMLTAKASEESKMEGLESAADDYITKPFNIKELSLRINNAITSRQKLRDKFRKCITVNPSEVTATSLDEQFLTKALQIIENHLTESEFSSDDFCKEIGISKTHVYRKLKALTNQSFTEFVRAIRLKRAASLLSMKSGNLTEIAYQTGFTNLSYFSRSFKEHFGVNPSEYN
jgi:signal transduction histidine kinase/DNA-binding response OmpR family regulator